MSLIERSMENCKRMTESRTSDGEGGYTAVWSEGTSFTASIVLTERTEQETADKSEAKERYTVTTATALNYREVIKRASGQYIRINSKAMETPSYAGFGQYKQYEAEGWKV